jgi:hypothetical protein
VLIATITPIFSFKVQGSKFNVNALGIAACFGSNLLEQIAALGQGENGNAATEIAAAVISVDMKPGFSINRAIATGC